MHDGISKFSSQLNGIYKRYADVENNPCSFPKVGGGLIAYGLTFHLIDEIRYIL